MAESLDNKISRIFSSCALIAAVTLSNPAYADDTRPGYLAADPNKGPCPEYICGPPQQPSQPLSQPPLPSQKPKEEPGPDYSTENTSGSGNTGKGFAWLLGGVATLGLGYVVGKEAAPDNTLCERGEHEKCDATSGQVFSLLLLGAGVVGIGMGIYYLTK